MARAPERSRRKRGRASPVLACASPSVRLTFYIPGFLDRVLVHPDEATPALSRLLSSALSRIDHDGAIAFLAPHYGVVKQQDWPLAPLRLAALEVDTDARYWLCATPV